MKHIWVVESSGGKKWCASGRIYVCAQFTKKNAKAHRDELAEQSPGLKWRVAKYSRIGDNS
jgi:hypothetical protein